jgi:multidrug efflux system membrane fusion protein
VAVFPTSGNGDSIPGVLTFVDNNVDQATGTILCKAEFPNRDGALWPGEFVNARVVLSVDSRVCVIPAQAVTASQSGTVVFVVRADEKVEARPVTVARSDDQIAVISKGVAPGERVVTDGQFRLAAGAKVLVKNAAGGGASGPDRAPGANGAGGGKEAAGARGDGGRTGPAAAKTAGGAKRS